MTEHGQVPRGLMTVHDQVSRGIMTEHGQACTISNSNKYLNLDNMVFPTTTHTAPRQCDTWRMCHLAELQHFGPHTANTNRVTESILVTIVKLTMPDSQWSQNGFCNLISIFGMKPEACDEAANSFITHFGVNAANNNIVTEIKL